MILVGQPVGKQQLGRWKREDNVKLCAWKMLESGQN
jgi:hypothetical protein